MLIYLRHGDDREDDAIYRHDRRLTERGKEKACKKARRLIEEHGHPDRVHASPYRRALDTAAAMAKSFTREVEIRRDQRIAQKLSGKQQHDPSVHPDTRSHVPLIEDRDHFRQRIFAHVNEVRHEVRSAGVLWCVTHQAVIEEVATQLGVKISGGLDFLDHVVIDL